MSILDTALALRSPLIGKQIGISPWVLIDQARIDAFAQVTDDQQFIHTDPIRSKAETSFGGTIAHGFLTLSMASRFAIDAIENLPGQIMNLNYGFDRVRFLTPVPSESYIRGRFILENLEKKSTAHLKVVMALTIEIKGHDKPALLANWINITVFPEDEVGQ